MPSGFPRVRKTINDGPTTILHTDCTRRTQPMKIYILCLPGYWKGFWRRMAQQPWVQTPTTPQPLLHEHSKGADVLSRSPPKSPTNSPTNHQMPECFLLNYFHSYFSARTISKASFTSPHAPQKVRRENKEDVVEWHIKQFVLKDVNKWFYADRRQLFQKRGPYTAPK